MSSEPFLPATNVKWEALSKHSFDFEPNDGNAIIVQSEPNLKTDVVIANQGFWQQTWIVQWGRRRVFDPFVVILRRGLEPKLLSLSAALGLTFGVFPVCGVTFVLCTIASVILRSRCHWPTLVLANFVVTPFQFGLVVPFVRVGELVTHGRHFPFTSKALWDVLRGRASRDVLFGILHAVIGWSIFAPVCFSFFYVIFLPIFGCLIRYTSTPMPQPRLPVSSNVYT